MDTMTTVSPFSPNGENSSDAALRAFTPALAGCWYDSHRGFDDIAREVIGDATNKGFDTAFDFDIDEDSPEGIRQSEDIFWIVDAAEAFLNDLAPEGYWIGWNDGDFGMWEDNEG